VQLAANAGAHVLAAATDPSGSWSASWAPRPSSTTPATLAAVQQEQPIGVHAVIHVAGDPAGVLEGMRSEGRFVSTMIQSPDQLPPTDAAVARIYANLDPCDTSSAPPTAPTGLPGAPPGNLFPGPGPRAFSAFAAATLGTRDHHRLTAPATRAGSTKRYAVSFHHAVLRQPSTARYAADVDRAVRRRRRSRHTRSGDDPLIEFGVISLSDLQTGRGTAAVGLTHADMGI
jgi:hypothetical protein